MKTDGRRAGKSPGERAEPREGGGGVGLVEAGDGGGDERLRIVGSERGRSVELTAGGELPAEALEPDAGEQMAADGPARPAGSEGRQPGRELRVEQIAGPDGGERVRGDEARLPPGGERI